MDIEVDIQNTSSGDIAESARSISFILQERRLSIRVSEPHAHKVSLVLPLHKNEGVHSIGLLTTCSVIVHVVLALCPHGPGAFAELEFVDSFSQTEDSLGW